MTKNPQPVVLFSRLARLIPDSSNKTKKKKKTAQTSHAAHKSHKFGVVDIDVHAGFLPDVFSAINASQSTFRFHIAIVPVRAGLGYSATRNRQIMQKFGVKPTHSKLYNHIYAPDLYKAVAPAIKAKAESYEKMGLVVSRMIVEPNSEGGLEWNVFSTSRGKTFIASAYKMREYSERVGRPFEACVAMIVAGQALADAIDRLAFHPETRGCVFDDCDKGGDIVQGLKAMKLCAECIGCIPKPLREDAKQVFSSIRSYERKFLKSA